MRNYPRISIVTPSYNQGQFLEETILSVLKQDYPNLEYIIIDGDSTDNSVDIIKKYKDQVTYWVSEEDRGQTHAINKGLRKSTGEILNWLNSDDLLKIGALNTIAEYFRKYPEAEFCFGDFSVIDKKGREIFSRKSAPYSFHSLLYGRQLSIQPSVFFRRCILEKIGYLDETLSFCMDQEFWIRAAVEGSKFYQTKKTLAKARFHGDTKTSRLQKVLKEEHKAIVRKYTKWGFKEGTTKEDLYYTFLNRIWRTINAIKRLIYRGDHTFMDFSIALKRINKESC